MDRILISKIVTGEAKVDIGKYTQDGVDLDYVIAVTKHDEFTGEERTEIISESLAWIDQEIKQLAEELDIIGKFRSIVVDKSIPVIEDYPIKERSD